MIVANETMKQIFCGPYNYNNMQVLIQNIGNLCTLKYDLNKLHRV